MYTCVCNPGVEMWRAAFAGCMRQGVWTLTGHYRRMGPSSPMRVFDSAGRGGSVGQLRVFWLALECDGRLDDEQYVAENIVQILSCLTMPPVFRRSYVNDYTCLHFACKTYNMPANYDLVLSRF